MPPRHETVPMLAGQWTLLTLNSVTAARVQNGDGPVIKVQANTSGTVAPTSETGAISLERRSILPADMPLSALYPGVAGEIWLWGFTTVDTFASVSHG